MIGGLTDVAGGGPWSLSKGNRLADVVNDSAHLPRSPTKYTVCDAWGPAAQLLY